ncbi:low affinity immunoglobulin epsilon Fc receptor-like [Aplysia californica]|uniref:Low affinity immunoglobulin epsilon Fc receptor-like n=1 Tax=Aplysia californica TaxID=6500 RepID=A0ABM0JPQ1_APLCA|nr:low affinity immunoglobulin epsilon Fc receptor-like [Aplysia californica]
MTHIFFLLIPGSTSSVDNCPSKLPRDKFLQYFQGICYEFAVTTYRHFYTATRECSQKGGLLALIKSEEINSFIQTELHDTYNERYDTWIGLDDANGEKKFTWADGSDVKYENWAPNEGERFHAGIDACATIDPVNGTWIDYPCKGYRFEEVKPYICQFNVIQPSTTQAPNTQAPTTEELTVRMVT